MHAFAYISAALRLGIFCIFSSIDYASTSLTLYRYRHLSAPLVVVVIQLTSYLNVSPRKRKKTNG